MIKAEIKDIKTDVNGNIHVVAEYVDEKNVVVQTGSTRYSAACKTLEEIKKNIKDDIEIHCESLIARRYEMNANSNMLSDLQIDMTGNKYQKDQAVIRTQTKLYTVDENNLLSVSDA